MCGQASYISVRLTLGQNGSRLSIGRMWISITKLKVTNTVAFPTTFYYQDSSHSQMVNSISVYNTVSKQLTSTTGKYTCVDCPMLK